MKKSRLPGILLVCFCFFACGEYEKLEIEKAARRSADSLYRANLDSLRIIFEEQCDLSRDSLYRIYFDSLERTEAQKILQLIDR